MPLKKGIKNIGVNISELKSTGHSEKQSIAISLKVAGKSRKAS
jgi:hypothetical protein